jgi:hypothetical protein
MVLWEEGITAEDEVIPTLICARKMGLGHELSSLAPHADLARYPVMEIVKRVRDGVPIVRVLPLCVGGETHAYTQVLSQVHIQVLSKHVKPAQVSEEYEQILKECGARWEENNHGRFSYKCLVGPILQLTVEAGGKLGPREVEGLGGDPLEYPAWHFPSPDLVANVYKALLDSAHGGGSKGFKYALDLYGKAQNKTPDKAIPAFVAWHLGAEAEPPAGQTVNPESRLRVARLLNKHLLDRYDDLRSIPEDSRYSGDVIWQDVEALWPRFARLLSLLSGPT